MTGDRGQVLTLEGVLAALVVLAGLVFALQAVVLTPSTSGATESPVDASQVDSMLSKAANNGTVREAVLDWGSNGFQGTPSGRAFYTGSIPERNSFLRTLAETFDNTVVFNVMIRYEKSTGGTGRQRMVYNGDPGDGAVRAETVVILYESDNPQPFFAPDASQTTDVYNVLEVEVVAWRG